jgi:HK97 family phage major capsid protein
MLSATAKFPRLASGLIPDWRNENDPIADKALTFDAVTLTARSLACRVNISWELFDDAPPASDVIEREFAAAFALEWDRVALRGTGTAPEPRGLRNTSGVTTTTLSPPNGASLTSYDWLLDAVQTIRASNFEPTGVLASPRTETALAKLREGGSTGMYLAPPSALANLPRLVSNQLPTNITTGTSNDTSEVFVGDWRHLLLGIRTSLRIRLLTERYADVGQFSFLADFRGDVGVTQASAFNIVAGIRP